MEENAVKVEIWNGQASCSSCKALLGNINDIDTQSKYCPVCGKVLDWSVINDSKRKV